MTFDFYYNNKVLVFITMSVHTKYEVYYSSTLQ